MSCIAPYHRLRPPTAVLYPNRECPDTAEPMWRSSLAWQVERPTTFAGPAFRRPGHIGPTLFGDGKPQRHRQPVRSSFQSPSPPSTPASWIHTNSSPRYATTASTMAFTSELSLSLSPQRARHYMGFEPGKGSPRASTAIRDAL